MLVFLEKGFSESPKFPTKVEIKEPVIFITDLGATKATTKVAAGTLVDVISVNNGQITLRRGTATGQAPLSATDYNDRLASLAQNTGEADNQQNSEGLDDKVFDLKKEIAVCAAIENSIERLAAYDSLASRIGVAQPITDSRKTAGRWILSTDISPIDDTKTFTLLLAANEDEKGSPCIIIRLKEGKFELFINYSEYLGLDETRVTTRIDKNPPEDRLWSISTDRKAIFFPGDDLKFVESLLPAKNLVVRLIPYGESPVTTSFDLTGLPEAIKPIFAYIKKR